MNWYRTGTASFTNGSDIVTGVGTDWINGAADGEGLQGPDGRTYEILLITSATALKLGSPYLGATAAAQPYAIMPTQSAMRDLAAQAAALVGGMQAVKDNAGAGKFGDGTQTVPGIRFLSEIASGIRRVSAAVWALVVSGVDILTLRATGVDIAGDTKVKGAAANLYLDSDTGALRLRTLAGVEKGAIRIAANDIKVEDAGGAERLRVVNAVGVSVTGELSVSAASTDVQIKLNRTTTSAGSGYVGCNVDYSFMVYSGDLTKSRQFSVSQLAPSNSVAVDANGNLNILNNKFLYGANSGGTARKLIGMTSANAVELGGDGQTVEVGPGGLTLVGGTLALPPNGNITTGGSGNFLIRSGTNGGGVQLRTDGATANRGVALGLVTSTGVFTPYLAFMEDVGSWEMSSGLRVTSGNLLAGISSAENHHHLVKSNNNNYAVTLRNTSATSPHGALINLNGVTGGTGTSFLDCSDDALRFRIAGTGNVVNINNSYGAISDRELKNLIALVGSQWDKFKRVAFWHYTLKADPTNAKLLGVVAQELELIYPGLIEDNANYEERETEPARTETKTLQRQKTTAQKSVTYETRLVDGQWRKVAVTQIVQVPVFETVALFDENGAAFMEVYESAQEEVLDEDGLVVTPAKGAEYRQATHQAPVMEEYTETIEIPAKMEQVATGTFTRSVKYSVLGMLADIVTQENMLRTETLEAISLEQKALIEALTARVAELEAV